MMGVTLALSLTGYLLPWDQKGYWATAVATNLMAEVPLIGPALQKIVVGGVEYGHHTLTRFFAFACWGFACDAHWSGCGSYLFIP